MIYLIIAICVLALLYFIGIALIFISCILRGNDSMVNKGRRIGRSSPRKHKKEIIDGGEWFLRQSPERVQISAPDGTVLRGLYLPAGNSRVTIILIHGYRSDALTDFGCAFQFYSSLGLNILTIDQRAHGKSGGRYICFGVKERYDCKAWCEYVGERAPGEIIIAGISMGSSTALMASGLTLPEGVKGIIADCGYTSPCDIFMTDLEKRHIPIKKAVLTALRPWLRLVAGWGVYECSTVTALSQNKLPVLFIHGDADKLVPYEMSLDNYEACVSEKELLTVNGAGHCMSYVCDTERYQDAVRRFLSKNTALSSPEDEAV